MYENDWKWNKRYPKVNKHHVRGTGADRADLPLYCKLGEFGQDLVDACMSIYNADKTHNDIGRKDTYEMSIDSPLKQYFPDTYQQVMLQLPATDGSNEFDYTNETKYADIINLARTYLPVEFYRARLAVLYPGDVLDWHIDTNTSVSCRAHFVIQGNPEWFIDKKGNIEHKIFNKGEIWFTNTGYMHKAVNFTQDTRITLTIGMHSSELEKIVPDIRLSKNAT